MHSRAVIFAVALVIAPPFAQAADLVVWWEKGFYPQEDAAVAEIIAAFEQKTGKQVELVQPAQVRRSKRRRRRSRPGSRPTSCSAPRADTGSPHGLTRTGWSTSRASSPPSWTCSMPTPSTRPPCSTARPADAASTPCRWAGIPTTSMSGTASWSGPASRSPTFPRSGRRSGPFWCDQVQPAVRKALGRDDVWGRRDADVGGGSRHRRRVLLQCPARSSAAAGGGARGGARPRAL